MCKEVGYPGSALGGKTFIFLLTLEQWGKGKVDSFLEP